VRFRAFFCDLPGKAPPVGRSLWRKRAKDGPLVGVKAKTIYPKKPDTWPDDWPPDTVLTLIQAGLLQGKSVGFVRLKSHAPTSHEIAANADMAKVSRVIDEWLLIEYALTFLPINQNALVETVSKSAVKPQALKQLGIDVPEPIASPTLPAPIPFTSEREIRQAIERRIARLDFEALATRVIDDGHRQGLWSRLNTSCSSMNRREIAAKCDGQRRSANVDWRGSIPPRQLQERREPVSTARECPEPQRPPQSSAP
jgi:hypothetical protein